jgi:hypothetical protein
MFITNKVMHGAVHTVLALNIRSLLALCIARGLSYSPTEIKRQYAPLLTLILKIGGPGLALLRSFLCDAEHRYGVMPGPCRRSSPSPSIGSSRPAEIGLGTALRAEKRQMHYLISEVFVLKRGQNMRMVCTDHMHFTLGIEQVGVN